jgi:hypothetical protein
MPTEWRVMLNSRLWNQSKYEEDFVTRPEVHRLAQSKGRCHMVSCPNRGDTVYFVYKGRIVMKGFVDSDGFEQGPNHQHHSCNEGILREHAIPKEFAWVKITTIGLSQIIRPTGQRTWAKMPV